jgi:radical SAM/Cys-rich protein
MSQLISLRRRGHDLADPVVQNRTLRELRLTKRFGVALRESGLVPFRSTGIEIFQINVGKVCNQVCAHCHVDAGPDRKEVMSDAILDRVLEIWEQSAIPTLDVTGGAPELHPRFREIMRRGAATGRRVIHRCNLTAIMTKPYWDIPDLLAELGIEIIASLPHYAKPCTDKQRGDGVFDTSIEAIRRLNELGYGKGTELVLKLVTNPVGAVLPGAEAVMECEWKREMQARYGVVFDRLLALTNLPISRFLDYLIETNDLDHYMTVLINAYNPKAAAAVMCRNTISVGFDGTLYDCDFNQMLELPVERRAPRTIFDWDLERLEHRTIVIGEHCYGCTAGSGSSCGGQVA